MRWNESPPLASVREEKPYDRAVEEHRVVFGSVDDCVEHLRWVRDEIGIDYLGASFWFGGLPQDKALRSMDMFAREVVPRLEKLTGRRRPRLTGRAPDKTNTPRHLVKLLRQGGLEGIRTPGLGLDRAAC